MLNTKYNRLLAGLFSRRVMMSVLEGQFPRSVVETLEVSGAHSLLREGWSVGRCFDEIYSILEKSYRCEYVYKNTLARAILAKYHEEQSAFLSEFRVDNCIADFLVLNGSSAVYEIKTELDGFDRLERQIATYKKAFDHIFVVTHPNQYERLKNRISDDVGIILLHAGGELEKVREAQSNKSNVDCGTLFNGLRRNEYYQLINNQYGYIPDTRPAERYTVCRALVEELGPETVHDEMVNLLKGRCAQTRMAAARDVVPKSLTMAYLASPFTKRQDGNFLSSLSRSLNKYI